MSRFIKIFFSILVVLVLIFSVFNYVDFGPTKGKKKGASAPSGCKSFTIKVDQQSKKNIAEIVNTLTNTSTIGLAFKSSHLRKIGAAVDKNVPSPLTFLAVIFVSKDLANQMKRIKKSSMKYNNFCEGLYKNMMRLSKDPKCFQFEIEGFAKSLGINPVKTFHVAETCAKHGTNGDKDAFIPFVDYLIQLKAK